MTEPIEQRPATADFPLETLNVDIEFKADAIFPDRFLRIDDHDFTWLVGPAVTRKPFRVTSEGKLVIERGQLLLPRGENHPLIKLTGMKYDAGLFQPWIAAIGGDGAGAALTIDGLSLYLEKDGSDLMLEQEVLGLPFFDQGLKALLADYIGEIKKFPKKVPAHELIAAFKEVLARSYPDSPGMLIRRDVPLQKLMAGGTTVIHTTIDGDKALLLPDGTSIALGSPAVFDIKNILENPLASQDLSVISVSKLAKPRAFENEVLPFFDTIEFMDPDGTKRSYSVHSNWAAPEATAIGLTDIEFYDMVMTHLYQNGRVTKGAEILGPRPLDPWNLEDEGDAMRELYQKLERPLPQIRLYRTLSSREELAEADVFFEKINPKFKDKFTEFGDTLIRSATEMTANFDLQSITSPDGVEAAIPIKSENLSFLNEISSPTQDWMGIRTVDELMATQPLRMLTQKHVTNGKLSLTGDINIPKGYRLAGFELPEIALTLTGPTEMVFQDLSFGYDAKTQTISTSGQSKGVYDVSNPKVMGLELDARLQGAVTMTGLNDENSDYVWGFHFEGEQTVTLNIERPVDIFPTEVPKERTRVTVKKMDYRIGKKTDGTERVVGTAALKVEGVTPQMNTSVNIELYE